MLKVSHSRLSTFRGCPWKYKLKYEDELIPIRQYAKAVTIGSVVHDAFYLHHNKVPAETIRKYMNSCFDKALSEAELVDQEDYTIARWIALGMFSHYPWYNDKNTSIVAEEYFSTKIANMRGVRLVGYIDRIITTDKCVMIGETKTTGMNASMFDNRCQVSDQAATYIYGARSVGIPASGVEYEVIKRPALRKRQDENADDFGQRLFLDYGDPNKKSMYYRRHTTYRNDEVLALYERDLVKTVKELRWMRKENAWYRNTDECFNYNRECPYRKICFTNKPDTLTLELFFKKGDSDERENEKTRLREIINKCRKKPRLNTGSLEGVDDSSSEYGKGKQSS